MTEAVIVGSTGLTGSTILKELLKLPSVSSVHAYARRDLTIQDPKLKPIVQSDSSQWSAAFPTVTTPTSSIMFSALGLPRARAGGLANQRLVEFDLSLELAKEARAKGVGVYVLISTAGANASSVVPYLKLKGDIEKAIIDIGFENCIIVRPGLIIGDRRAEHYSFGESMMQKLAGLTGSIAQGLKDVWAQDVDVIGRAAINAGLRAVDGKSEEKASEGREGSAETKIWYLEQKDVVRLGRTEWTK